MGEGWRSLSARSGRLDGAVPDYLEAALQEWLNDATDRAERGRAAARLRFNASMALLVFNQMSGSLLLDAVDCVLDFAKFSTYGCPHDQMLDRLSELLLDAGSAYQVSADGRSLERRVDPTVTVAVERTLRTAGESPAAHHLAAAWSAAYGVHPDPPRAYAEAIKAVEAAAQPVIAPKEPKKATLGKMNFEMSNPDRVGTWRVTLPGPRGDDDLTAVVAMCRSLWNNQTSRHGSGHPTRYETQAEAEAAVQLAMVLVSWFTGGAIREV